MQLRKHRFNHSASICHYNGYDIVCWYYANMECDDEERIGVASIKDGHAVDFIEIDRMAGNGIVFEHNKKLNLLYSRFRRPLNLLKYRVDRWQHCILKVARLDVDENGKLSIVKKPRALRSTQSTYGLLPRCNASYVIGKSTWITKKSQATLIPLYFERASNKGHAEIFFFKDEDDKGKTNNIKRPEYLEYFDSVGEKIGSIIQPTVWYEYGFGYQLLARNFQPAKEPYAWYSKSKLIFRFNTPKKLKRLYNNNNSISVFRDYSNDITYVLWNNDKVHRKNLTLGELKSTRKGPLVKKLINFGTGSYPNGVVAPNGDISVVYTKPGNTGGKVIEYQRITRDDINARRTRNARKVSSATRG